MRALVIAGYGWVAIGAERIALSPDLTGPSDLAAAGMVALNIAIFVIPGLIAAWIGEGIEGDKDDGQ